MKITPQAMERKPSVDGQPPPELESPDMLRIITENVDDLALLVTRSGRVVYHNNALFNILGHSPEMLAARQPREWVHPEDWPAVRAQLAALFALGEATLIRCRLRHRDESWRSFEVRGVGVRGHGRRPDRAFLLARDITEQVNQDLEFARFFTIKTLMLENAPLGIAFVHHRAFSWVNDRFARILDRNQEEFLGVSTRLLYPSEEDFVAAEQEAYPLLALGQRSDATRQLQRRDGTLFWGRLMGNSLERTSPEEGTVWLLEDVSSQIAAEQQRQLLEIQLRQAQKLEAIGQLATGIAHEINTPTQYIGDNTKFLAQAFQAVFTVMAAQADQLGPGALPEALARITEEADLPFLQEEIPKAIEQSLEGIARVTGIVQAMKDFSHPGGDQPEAMDLNQSIESTATVSRGEWKNVAELALDLDPEMPIVIGFPGEFNQVVLNLIVNAAHAIGERSRQNPDAKGLISISTRRDGDMAEVRIGDTGTGIPEWVQTRMFDLFFTTKAVGKGTGQGLSLVHNIVVKRHGGSIRFETRQGEGTVFLIRIPIQGPADHVNGRIQSAH